MVVGLLTVPRVQSVAVNSKFEAAPGGTIVTDTVAVETFPEFNDGSRMAALAGVRSPDQGAVGCGLRSPDRRGRWRSPVGAGLPWEQGSSGWSVRSRRLSRFAGGPPDVGSRSGDASLLRPGERGRPGRIDLAPRFGGGRRSSSSTR